MKIAKCFSFLLLLCYSCTYVSENISKKMLPPMDTVIDYHKIDALPIHESCADQSSKFNQDRCTRDTLYRSVALPLLMLDLKSEQKVNQKVSVKLLVDKKGKISLYEILPKNGLDVVPGLEDELKEIIQNLPSLKPAKKKGQNISVYYNLPLNMETGS